MNTTSETHTSKDFQNILNLSSNAELLKMVEVCLTSEWLRGVVVSQPESVLSKIREDFKLPNNYEVAELIHRLNQIEFSDVLRKFITREVMMEQLNDINPDTKGAMINYKRTEFKKKSNELIREFFKEKFSVRNDGKKPTDNIPKYINIREAHGNSVVFDFYVRKGEQEVIFNGNKLHEANHFFHLWLGDFDGFDNNERFRQLYAINATSLVPFMNELYLYDSIYWDGTEVCGILNNQGDVVLPSKFSQIERIGVSDYFKAYRLKLYGEIESEGWEYYDNKGKRVSGIVVVESDEKYEKDLINQYEFALKAVWTQDELEEMNAIGQRKFSKWCISLDLLPELTSNFVIDYKNLYRNPNIKHYLVKDLYVSFFKNGTKEIFGIGIDPDMNIAFNPDEE